MNDYTLIISGLRNRIARRMIQYDWRLDDPRIRLLRQWHREARSAQI